MTESPDDTAALSPADQTAYRRLHADATALLRAWEPPDSGQEALRADYLTHLGDYPWAVAKAGPPEHLTASVLVLDEGWSGYCSPTIARPEAPAAVRRSPRARR